MHFYSEKFGFFIVHNRELSHFGRFPWLVVHKIDTVAVESKSHNYGQLAEEITQNGTTHPIVCNKKTSHKPTPFFSLCTGVHCNFF